MRAVRARGAGRRRKEMGAAPTAPQGQSRNEPAGSRNEKGNVYSLALNSSWNLRGSVTDAVYGTPTAADRLLSPVT